MNNNYNQVYQFKIELQGVKPKVWRRIQVPESYSFWDLHVAVQDAMGWFDSHLHAFHIKNPSTGKQEEMGCYIDPLMENDFGKISCWDRKISEYFSPENSSALYLYDFGDYWQHDITLEKILPCKKEIDYPICLAGENACPPEDCGGSPGYADLLQTNFDPDEEDYEEFMEWLGEDFDPKYFNVDDVVFYDPEEQWEEQYGEFKELEEGHLEGSDEIGEETKERSLEFIHDIWEKVKADDFEELSPEELRLAKILKEHEEEFFNQFEFADLINDHEYGPEEEIDPFLHIFIHSIIEAQLESKEPVEALQFYNSMIEKNCDHHAAVHFTGAILVLLMPPVLQNSGPFDIYTYKYLLRKYMTEEPEKIYDLLEQEEI